jgi:hypothetical protein
MSDSVPYPDQEEIRKDYAGSDKAKKLRLHQDPDLKHWLPPVLLFLISGVRDLVGP